MQNIKEIKLKKNQKRMKKGFNWSVHNLKKIQIKMQMNNKIREILWTKEYLSRYKL